MKYTLITGGENGRLRFEIIFFRDVLQERYGKAIENSEGASCEGGRTREK